jgi:uncharacterized protein YqjF (DUF2071 family)
MAKWRYLAMINFEVDPSVLRSHVPRGTTLDEHGGRHFVSLVAFLFLDTHLLTVPAFFHQNFEEINLRFYVRRMIARESRQGAVFIREMVPLPLVAAVAKLTYNEPYRTVPMEHTIVDSDGELQSVEYLFGAPRDRCRLTVHVDGSPRDIDRGSEEEFLSQRGWGYTRQRDGGTIEYKVDHPRWRVWPHAHHELDGPLEEFYEQPFPSILRGPCVSAFVADGSAVSVHMPERIA